MFQMLGQIGVAVWMFIIMCLVSLIAAGRYAWGGARAPRLPVVLGLAAAQFFATGAVVAKGLVMVMGGYARWGATSPRALERFMEGSAEALSGAMLGFATLTLIALLVVVGYRRRATST